MENEVENIERELNLLLEITMKLERELDSVKHE